MVCQTCFPDSWSWRYWYYYCCCCCCWCCYLLCKFRKRFTWSIAICILWLMDKKSRFVYILWSVSDLCIIWSFDSVLFSKLNLMLLLVLCVGYFATSVLFKLGYDVNVRPAKVKLYDKWQLYWLNTIFYDLYVGFEKCLILDNDYTSYHVRIWTRKFRVNQEMKELLLLLLLCFVWRFFVFVFATKLTKTNWRRRLSHNEIRARE